MSDKPTITQISHDEFVIETRDPKAVASQVEQVIRDAAASMAVDLKFTAAVNAEPNLMREWSNEEWKAWKKNRKADQLAHYEQITGRMVRRAPGETDESLRARLKALRESRSTTRALVLDSCETNPCSEMPLYPASKAIALIPAEVDGITEAQCLERYVENMRAEGKPPWALTANQKSTAQRAWSEQLACKVAASKLEDEARAPRVIVQRDLDEVE